MINNVKILDDRINFSANSITKKPEKNDVSEIVPNTLGTRVLQKYDKTFFGKYIEKKYNKRE